MREMPYALGWHDVRVKPSGKYEARWADENGNARGKCFMTKPQARKYAGDKARGILDSSVGLGVATKDVQEAAASFLSRRILDASNAIYERHLNDFFETMAHVVLTGHLTREVIERYDAILEQRGHNPGGRRHIWKSLKTFANFCIENHWLGVSPFFKLKSPRSTFEGRALFPNELLLMTTADPRYPVDIDISRALRIGNPGMLRISSVWALRPEDFREPGELHIAEIKFKPAMWVPLHPTALAAIRDCLAVTPPGVRFFARWPTVDAMRQSLRRKARRVGLRGVRFHDAAKVSRVSELDAAGYGLGALSELSNTSKQTLARHYIKADRRKVFDMYKHFQSVGADKVSGTNIPVPGTIGLPPRAADLPQTYSGPEMGSNRSETVQQAPIDPMSANNGNGAETCAE